MQGDSWWEGFTVDMSLILQLDAMPTAKIPIYQQ